MRSSRGWERTPRCWTELIMHGSFIVQEEEQEEEKEEIRDSRDAAIFFFFFFFFFLIGKFLLFSSLQYAEESTHKETCNMTLDKVC